MKVCLFMPQLDVRMLRTALKRAVLKTRQQNMCLPFIQRNYDLLEGGSEPPSILVCNGVIVDGNHRYVAGIAFGRIPPMREWAEQSNPPPIVPWDQVFFDPTEWGP